MTITLGLRFIPFACNKTVWKVKNKDPRTVGSASRSVAHGVVASSFSVRGHPDIISLIYCQLHRKRYNDIPPNKLLRSSAGMSKCFQVSQPHENKILLGSLSMQRFWATDGHLEWTVLLFYLSSHYHIYIFKSLCASRDDYLKFRDRPMSWPAKCSLPVAVRG